MFKTRKPIFRILSGNFIMFYSLITLLAFIKKIIFGLINNPPIFSCNKKVTKDFRSHKILLRMIFYR